MIQVSGAGSESGDAMVIWGENTTWGFGFNGSDEDDNNDWLNLMWGNGNYGVLFNLGMDSEKDDNLGTETSSFGLEMGVGMNTSYGEWGVMFATQNSDDGTDADQPSALGAALNFRGKQSAWLFDNAKAGFWMDNDDMGLSYDLFTHVKPVDGVTALVGMGFEYLTTDAGDGSQMWLPNATFAVEAAMTDWTTFRGFVEQNHWVSCEAADGSDCGSGNSTDYGFGVGFVSLSQFKHFAKILAIVVFPTPLVPEKINA